MWPFGDKKKKKKPKDDEKKMKLQDAKKTIKKHKQTRKDIMKELFKD